jgi:hypothetical protein
MLAIPKHPRIEMPKLRRSARLAPYCFGCMKFNDGDCVLAHANWHEYHKGKHLKASDIFGAVLCQSCHGFVDNAANDSDERKDLWRKAHIETLYWWVMTGVLK